MKKSGNYINDYDDIYVMFREMTIEEIQQRLLDCENREEKAFFRTILNLKLQIEQEKIIGRSLL